MNSFSKKLYAVLIVSVLMLCFSVAALASGAIDPGTTITPSSSATDSSGESSSAVAPSSDMTESGDGSSSLTDTSSSESDPGLSSDSSLTDTSSDPLASATISMQSSTTEVPGATVSTVKPTSSKTQYGGTVDTEIDDGIDTSGWGEESSEPVSVGVTGEKAGSKKMLDVAQLFWILIWIPILLIIASIAALIYVNRKGFVGGADSGASTAATEEDAVVSSSEKKEKKKKSGKTKENQNKRTNVYRPRD